MNWLDLATLFLAMAALAAVPSTSVLLVVTRSATGGARRGLAVASGIVLGDLLFLSVAFLGLAGLAQTMEGLFRIVQTLGAAYLIWLGISLVRPRDRPSQADQSGAGPGGDFLSGLVLTLGDLKAIVFYASLLPGLVGPTPPTLTSLATLGAITVVAVGGVKAVYALFAGALSGRLVRPRLKVALDRLAGGVLLVAGSYIMTSGL